MLLGKAFYFLLGSTKKNVPICRVSGSSCHFTMKTLVHEFQTTPHYNILPLGQSSWNFTGLLLTSVPNKCDPYWTDSKIFWKCQFLSLWNKGQKIDKIWNFADLSETRWKPRSWVILSIWYNKKWFWFEKVPIFRVLGSSCHFTMNTLTHEFQAMPHFNILPVGQSS